MLVAVRQLDRHVEKGAQAYTTSYAIALTMRMRCKYLLLLSSCFLDIGSPLSAPTCASAPLLLSIDVADGSVAVGVGNWV